MKRKAVKALIVKDKGGKEVPLPNGYHIEGTGNNLILVQRVSKVLMNPNTHQKTITWESKPDPDYTVTEETRTINEQQDKVFEGTEDEAEQAGWVENEFGFVCPECSGDGTSSVPESSTFEGRGLLGLAVTATVFSKTENAEVREGAKTLMVKDLEKIKEELKSK